MIGSLPTSLSVNDTEYQIRSDYRDCLRIMEAFADEELDIEEKIYISLVILYKDFDRMSESDYEEAYRQLLWFLNGGDTYENEEKSKPVMDWKQDESLYFPAINKVAGREVRAMKYLHFWTFLGYYQEIGEGTFATVVNIRNKKNKGKKLEKYEQDFYRSHKNMIDLKRKYTAEEQASLDAAKRLVGR